ncbi:MAG: phosphatidylserine decarboxylase family protein [Marinilabiliales bacterium]
MKIHKEGYKIIILFFFILLILNVLLYFIGGLNPVFIIIIILSLLIFFWILFFFRNPVRLIKEDNNAVYCPADGKIVVIEKVIEKEYFRDERIQVSIFMSPLNVHVNRYPVSGEIIYTKHHNGLYLVAWHPKSSEENERFTTVIKQKDGQEILVRQIAGIMARRIISYSQTGTVIRQGDEMGIIRFGSRVDVFLPLNYKLNVSIKETVKANKNILAFKNI